MALSPMPRTTAATLMALAYTVIRAATCGEIVHHWSCPAGTGVIILRIHTQTHTHTHTYIYSYISQVQSNMASFCTIDHALWGLGYWYYVHTNILIYICVHSFIPQLQDGWHKIYIHTYIYIYIYIHTCTYSHRIQNYGKHTLMNGCDCVGQERDEQNSGIVLLQIR